MTEAEEEAVTPLPIYWRDVPSITVDGVLGTARAGGLHRVVLGEVVFNSDPAATGPALRPICNLILTPLAVQGIITQLQDLLDGADAGSS